MAIVGVVLVSALIWGIYYLDSTPSQPMSNSETSTEVPIEEQYGDKVVYTTDLSVDDQSLRQDCQERGGEFNSCGSVCPSDSEMCIEVCAYTCDNILVDEGDDGLL